MIPSPSDMRTPAPGVASNEDPCCPLFVLPALARKILFVDQFLDQLFLGFPFAGRHELDLARLGLRALGTAARLLEHPQLFAGLDLPLVMLDRRRDVVHHRVGCGIPPSPRALEHVLAHIFRLHEDKVRGTAARGHRMLQRDQRRGEVAGGRRRNEE